jgi:hypothetical protein
VATQDGLPAPERSHSAVKREARGARRGTRPPKARAAAACAVAAALLALLAHAAAPQLIPAALRMLGLQRGGGAGAGAVSELAVDMGARLLGPSFGLYPRGCRWREVTYKNGSGQVHRAGGNRAPPVVGGWCMALHGAWQMWVARGCGGL